MTKTQMTRLFILRILLGWLFLWAGMTKVLNPNFSAAKYLQAATTFNGFYQWLAGPSMLPLTNFVNEWGLTLLGISLILGVGMKLSTKLGAILMVLYYFPVLTFPYVAHSYLVDEHIIYAAALLVLGTMHAGKAWGLEDWFAMKCPKMYKWLG